MGAVYQGFTYRASNLTTTPIGDKPAGTASGDLLIAFGAANGAGTWGVGSSGFTSSATSSQGGTFYRICDGTEGSTFTFAQSNGLANSRIIIVRFTGAHPSAPIDDIENITSSSGANLSATVAPTFADSTLVAIFCAANASDGTLAVPSGMTSQHVTTASPARAIGTQTGVGTGSITKTWTNASGASRVHTLVAIRTAAQDYAETPADTSTATDAVAKAVTRPTSDTSTSSDASIRQPGKGAADTVTSGDSLTGKVIGKGAADVPPVFDSSGRAVGKPAADTVGTADTSTRAIGRNPSDFLAPADAKTFTILKGIADTATAQEDITLILGLLRSIGEVSEAVDEISKAFTMGTQTAQVAVSEAFRASVNLGLTETASVSDNAARLVAFLREANDLVGIADVPAKHLTLAFSDVIGAVSDWPLSNPTRVIAGVIVNHETGALVEGALVRLFRTTDDAFITTTSSAPDGSYSFARDEADPYTYYVTAEYTDGVQVHGVSDRGQVPA